MKISFDLDGTLIPDSSISFSIEKRRWWHKLLSIELMRKGTPQVINMLKSRGHQVGIYTTSFRKTSAIQFWLICYRTKADFIINEQRNSMVKLKTEVNSSKYPPAFNIDLHIDDLPGVGMEGTKYGFKTLIIPSEETDFSQCVYDEVERLLTNPSVPKASLLTG